MGSQGGERSQGAKEKGGRVIACSYFAQSFGSPPHVINILMIFCLFSLEYNIDMMESRSSKFCPYFLFFYQREDKWLVLLGCRIQNVENMHGGWKEIFLSCDVSIKLLELNVPKDLSESER